MTTPTLYLHPALLPLAPAVTGRPDWPVGDLARLTRLLAADLAGALRSEAVHDPAERWYLRLALTQYVEVWLLTWTPGQGTRPHDHGGAAGSYTVLDGVLTETWRDGSGPSHRAVRPHGTGSAFGPERVHVVANRGLRDATSVHAYSPPLLPLGEGVLTEPGR
ncbi:MAG TPA: cysteine dioxygenase family protein [Mycobacteriales bacterium]|jgi:predicted metal-dependent enzyme (double-stranded beta helix superfamily)|nr:cysteine dioxygenase family protein [Mycobacteriales bacterium]